MMFFHDFFSAEKYCRLVEAEGGTALLDELLEDQCPDTKPYDKVIELATIVRNNVRSWKRMEKGQAEEVAAHGQD